MKLECRFRLPRRSFDLDVDLCLEGSFFGLYGPSGSGKSSLLQVIQGLQHPERGYVSINGRVLFDSAQGIRLAVHQRRVGMVFQDHRLFPHMSVLKNIHYGQKYASRVLAENEQQKLLECLGLQALLGQSPKALSGGEQQRVAIARALFPHPELLLLDEPLSAVDFERRAEILPALKEIQEKLNIPMLMVSHELSDLNQVCEQVIRLEQGRVIST